MSMQANYKPIVIKTLLEKGFETSFTASIEEIKENIIQLNFDRPDFEINDAVTAVMKALSEYVIYDKQRVSLNYHFTSDSDILECLKICGQKIADWHIEKITKPDYDMWHILPGSRDEGFVYLDEFIETNTIGVGWGKIRDISNLSDLEIEKTFEKYYDKGLGSFQSFTKIKPKDIVVLTRGQEEIIDFGIVTSDYEFHDVEKPSYPHRKNIVWLNQGPILASELPGQTLSYIRATCGKLIERKQEMLDVLLNIDMKQQDELKFQNSIKKVNAEWTEEDTRKRQDFFIKYGQLFQLENIDLLTKDKFQDFFADGIFHWEGGANQNKGNIIKDKNWEQSKKNLKILVDESKPLSERIKQLRSTNNGGKWIQAGTYTIILHMINPKKHPTLNGLTFNSLDRLKLSSERERKTEEWNYIPMLENAVLQLCDENDIDTWKIDWVWKDFMKQQEDLTEAGEQIESVSNATNVANNVPLFWPHPHMGAFDVNVPTEAEKLIAFGEQFCLLDGKETNDENKKQFMQIMGAYLGTDVTMDPIVAFGKYQTQYRVYAIGHTKEEKFIASNACKYYLNHKKDAKAFLMSHLLRWQYPNGTSTAANVPQGIVAFPFILKILLNLHEGSSTINESTSNDIESKTEAYLTKDEILCEVTQANVMSESETVTETILENRHSNHTYLTENWEDAKENHGYEDKFWGQFGRVAEIFSGVGFINRNTSNNDRYLELNLKKVAEAHNFLLAHKPEYCDFHVGDSNENKEEWDNYHGVNK